MTIDDDMFVVEADFVVIDAIGGIVFQEMRKNFRLLSAMISASRRSKAILNAQRPIRPKPFIASLTILPPLSCYLAYFLLFPVADLMLS